MKRKSFKVIEANVMFLLLAIVFITVGASVQRWDVHKGLLITEYMIIFLPVIIAGKIFNVDFKEVLKLNPIKMRTLLRIMAISFLILPMVALVNLIPITILSVFDKVMIPSIPSPTTAVGLMTSFFIVAISPGICEEVLFRGMILNAYENSYNKKQAAIVAAVLFGLFHFNIQNLFGPIIIGLVAAYLMQITNSLYAAIALHMTNNGISVLSDYLWSNYNPQMVETATEATSVADTATLLASIQSLFIVGAVGLFFARLLINGLKRDTFYFALGEPFTLEGKSYYLVEKSSNYGKIISKRDAFSGGDYNIEAEQSVSFKLLNVKRPERIYDIWRTEENKEVVDPKVFTPLVGAVGLYVYILFLFLTY